VSAFLKKQNKKKKKEKREEKTLTLHFGGARLPLLRFIRAAARRQSDR
jgi:hypothetical protein